MMVKSFSGGVYLPHYKHLTEAKPIERLPLPLELIIPLKQHTGAPCEALVAVGDRVKAGQKIGESRSPVSAPVHSPLNGIVKEIVTRQSVTGEMVECVVIACDSEQEMAVYPAEDVSSLSAQEIKDRIREAGVVGMGGAAFPTYMKLSPPKHVDTLIINGCECEPFLTCDHRLMLERVSDIIVGARLIAKVLGVSKIVFAVETNKQDALDLLNEKIRDEEGMEAVPLDIKYPQGSEKQLIYAVSQRVIPTGKLPYDVGVVVQNVATAAAVKDAVVHRRPLMERVVTLTGSGVKNPGNYLVPVGTTLRHVVEAAGGLNDNAVKIIVGGPMTGRAQSGLDVPLIKGSGGILAFDEDFLTEQDYLACVRCGKCVEHCPMLLYPNYIGQYAELGRYEMAENWGAKDCFECGACVYVCPSSRPIVNFVRQTKAAAAKRHRESTRQPI